MVDLGLKVNFGRLEGVVGGEVDHDEEDTTGIRAIARPHNGGLPVKEVFAHRPSAAGSGRVSLQVLQLLLDALGRHGYAAAAAAASQ